MVGKKRRYSPGENASSLKQETLSNQKDSRKRAGRDFISKESVNSRGANKVAGKRGRLLLVVVAFLLVLCSARLFDLQVVQAPALADEARQARTVSAEIVSKRGDIVDRKGTVLATSIEVYNVSVNQILVKDYVHHEIVSPDGKIVTDKTKLRDPRNQKKVIGTGAAEAARQLAPILEMNPAVLGGKMVGSRGFVYLAKNVSAEKWRKIRKLKIDGIDGELRYQRQYPNGATASSILGFTDFEQVGRAGIEATQNKQLAGVPGKRVAEISPSGQVIPGGADVLKAATPGKTVRLTIDADLQNTAESLVNKQVADFGAAWGTAIVQRVGTGQILALADSGNEPPEQVRKRTSGTTGSRAVQYTYEPGSSGKLVTFATALEQKKITPLTPVNSSDKITIAGQSFRDSHSHSTKRLTASGVLAESSNTGTVQIGQMVTDQQRYQMMKSLGLGQKTGIEMPGESAGIIGSPKSWDARQRMTTMFGQGMACTPLQMSALISTIANHGVYVAPRMISEYEDSQGIPEKAKVPAAAQKLDQNAAATLVRMMESVTSDEGTAKKAQIPGYRSAGKTGTSEIISGGGGSRGVVASFTGLAPAENPEIAVSVIIYQPKSGIYGGVVAGPVFSQVAAQALTLLDVPPSSTKPQLYPIEAH
ncbi:penicillin-binding protein 2 [Varibaculum cambriense]|uniref:peptidoglycan D,D-transpeptidase FtsI family protein n=1 Tax=Varibaculum cambriense TaxID=184870 RepID=UPI00241D1E1A|nr:penicillin-binding protein 2 [Varibaculum cambriense]